MVGGVGWLGWSGVAVAPTPREELTRRAHPLVSLPNDLVVSSSVDAPFGCCAWPRPPWNTPRRALPFLGPRTKNVSRRFCCGVFESPSVRSTFLATGEGIRRRAQPPRMLHESGVTTKGDKGHAVSGERFGAR